MPDRSTELIVQALSRAALTPNGSALHGTKSLDGLFPTNASAKQAAQRCLAEGWLQIVRTENRGKSRHDFCAITDKGKEYLSQEADPKHLLEDFIRVLENRQGHIQEILASIQLTQAGIQSLQSIAQSALCRLPVSNVGYFTNSEAVDWKSEMLKYLAARRDRGNSGDCPLPELYQMTKSSEPELTLGAFHDELRNLHSREQIWLHPWTGPLYELPEPACALMVGHEVVYYVSAR